MASLRMMTRRRPYIVILKGNSVHWLLSTGVVRQFKDRIETLVVLDGEVP